MMSIKVSFPAFTAKPELFPYGSDVGDFQVSLKPFSMLNSPPLSLRTPFTFFGKKYINIVVSLLILRFKSQYL